MTTQADVNAYLNALHQAEINKFLTAYNNATPEQKAQIDQVAHPTTQPAAPAAPATPPKQYQQWQMYDPNDPSRTTSFYGTDEEAQQYAAANGLTIGTAAKKDDKKKADGSDEDQGAQAYITEYLRKYGLDSLAPWAMEMLKQGLSQAEVKQQLRERPEYKARFAGMETRRNNKLGALSEDEYIAFENTAKNYLQSAGVAPQVLNDPAFMAHLVGDFQSVDQVSKRIENGYLKVAQGAPEIRQAFQTYFGVAGDAQLATWFFNPELTEPILQRMADQAVIGGYGARQGLSISQGQAGNIADMGFSTQQIQAGTQQAGQLSGLQNQTVDEAAAKAAGLTGDALVGGVFGTDKASSDALKNRLGTRKAQFDSRGTAAATQKGAYGLESAQ